MRWALRTAALAAGLLLGPRGGWAQQGPEPGRPPQPRLDSLLAKYPFLCPEANRIENAAGGLQHFYARLRAQPARRLAQLANPALPSPVISVVHIGDSHLQADQFSGRVRRELQRVFGNAGRGLVFPFQVARTNEPASFRTASASRWQVRRVVSADTALPLGLSGLTLATTAAGAAFTLRIPLALRPDYQFNRLTLLHAPGPAAFGWEVRNAQGRLLGTLPGAAAQPGAFSSALAFDSLRNFVELRTVRTAPGQTGAQLFGLLLDNGRPGLRYHAIGVNGAAVHNYNGAPQFFAQLGALAPDLFVVSLGTNDAFWPKFEAGQFARDLDAFVGQLRRRYPGADILVTAPADALISRQFPAPNLPVVRAILRRYCQDNGLAYWDFFAAMGGAGAVRTWRQQGLAQPDFVHFTPRGYDVQGLLLYLALQDGFHALPAALPRH